MTLIVHLHLALGSAALHGCCPGVLPISRRYFHYLCLSYWSASSSGLSVAISKLFIMFTMDWKRTSMRLELSFFFLRHSLDLFFCNRRREWEVNLGAWIMFAPPERSIVLSLFARSFFFFDYILSHFLNHFLKLHSGEIDGVENILYLGLNWFEFLVLRICSRLRISWRFHPLQAHSRVVTCGHSASILLCIYARRTAGSQLITFDRSHLGALDQILMHEQSYIPKQLVI